MARRRKTESGFGAIPLGAWRILFLTGTDFLGELRPYGIVAEEAAREAAIEIWPACREGFVASLDDEFHRIGTWIERATAS